MHVHRSSAAASSRSAAEPRNVIPRLLQTLARRATSPARRARGGASHSPCTGPHFKRSDPRADERRPTACQTRDEGRIPPGGRAPARQTAIYTSAASDTHAHTTAVRGHGDPAHGDLLARASATSPCARSTAAKRSHITHTAPARTPPERALDTRALHTGPRRHGRAQQNVHRRPVRHALRPRAPELGRRNVHRVVERAGAQRTHGQSRATRARPGAARRACPFDVRRLATSMGPKGGRQT